MRDKGDQGMWCASWQVFVAVVIEKWRVSSGDIRQFFLEFSIRDIRINWIYFSKIRISMIELELKLDIMKRILSIRLNIVEQWKNIVITKSSKCIGCIKG